MTQILERTVLSLYLILNYGVMSDVHVTLLSIAKLASFWKLRRLVYVNRARNVQILQPDRLRDNRFWKKVGFYNVGTLDTREA
jgi:hypothetical protein